MVNFMMKIAFLNLSEKIFSKKTNFFLKKGLTNDEKCVIIYESSAMRTNKLRNALLAQLVEHLTLNQGVQSSSL